MKISNITISRADPGCVIELATGDGTSGLAIGPATAVPWLEDVAREMLVGEDPRAVSALWDALRRAGAPHGTDLDETIAALDLALWDLKARAAGEPLWRTLGAARPQVNVYATLPAINTRLEAELERLSADYGLREAKVVADAVPEADLEHLLTVRRALEPNAGVPGAEPVLLLDARAAWDAKEAAQRIQWLERQVDIAWVEDPRPGWDFLGLGRIGDAIRGAVCSGGRLGPDQFLPLLHHMAANVLEIDISRTGISGALRIADAAMARELPVTLAAIPGNLHVQLAAVLPNVVNVELAAAKSLPPPLTSDVRISHGRASAGDLPGLGLTKENGA